MAEEFQEEPAEQVSKQTSPPLPEGLGTQVIALFTSTLRQPNKKDNKILPKVEAKTPAKWAQSAPTQEHTTTSGDVLRKDQKDVTHPPENSTTATPTIINIDLVPYVTLHLAALNGDWMTARNFLQLQPEAVRAKITKGSETALHIAAGAKRTLFVEELVMWMTPNDLELKNDVGNTALYFAAVSGIKRIAEVMVDINPTLPQIRDVALDIIQKHPKMAFARDGNGETALHVMARKPSACYSGSHLGFLQRWITSYVSVDIVEQHPEITSGQDEIVEITLHIVEHSTCYSVSQRGLWKRFILSVPYIQDSYHKYLNHMQATELVTLLWKKVLTLDSDSRINDLINVPSRILFTAAELGNIDFLIICMRLYPSLIWQIDEQNRSIFHAAVIHRQEKVFNLIYDLGGLKDLIAAYKDVTNNNMLHLAARASASRLSTDTGAALQLRRELIWFKEVEKIVQPLYKEMRNSDGEIPQLLFTKEHKELLREGEVWMKGTASSCMVVATLIATVMFAVISTVPGGNNNNTGIPIFLKSRAFTVFVISDAISLITSTTSILSFLSILTSRYHEGDFLNSLPNRLIVGLATLFISIATMMITFVATLLMVLGPGFHEIKVPITLVAAVPVGFYALLQFPLLADMISHAYISRVSFRPCNHLLH
uniref:ankyrin repeat-containing protein At3g12360-like isoform X2 n=1 Tax=Fragaria vesca subsp. vesca TaxID=101020 RepID=UPI0005CA8AB5|nr:PREDICTED: ankyrin repeat-containing protein At3g12360-like isoform X2 [Fragaria vesca subsp. vesca]